MSKYDNVINELLKPAGTEEEISDEEANIYDGNTEGGGIFPFDVSGIEEAIEQDAYEESDDADPVVSEDEKTNVVYNIRRLNETLVYIIETLEEKYGCVDEDTYNEFICKLDDVDNAIQTLYIITGDF